MKIDKSIYISDLIDIDDEINILLLKEGMHCVGCLSAIGETLEEACIVHGIDADEMEDKINEYLASKEQ